MVLAVTTARNALNIGVTFRTAAFSRAEMDRVIAGFKRCIESLEGPKLAQPERRSPIVLALAATGCATRPVGTPVEVPTRDLQQHAVLRSLTMGPVLEERILALDPTRVSDDDVRRILAAGPTPRILSLHGGIYPVHW